MEVKYTNPNGETILESKLNLVDFFFKFGKIVKIEFKNKSNKLFSQEDATIFLQDKVLHNLYITNSNMIDQIFLYRK